MSTSINHTEPVNEYIYPENLITLTHADGSIETHCYDGSGSLLHLDGSIEYWYTDGSRRWVGANGSTSCRNADGSGSWRDNYGNGGSWRADGSPDLQIIDGSRRQCFADD